jgi:dolichyl-phosphate beta-glucosyltransferase
LLPTSLPIHMLSVVIPCYNSSSFIDVTVESLLTFLVELVPSFEIVLVDDGSTDETPKLITAWSLKDSRIKALNLPENSGKGAAVRAGVLSSRGNVVVFTDADLPYHLTAIPQALAAIQNGADVVLGSRQFTGQTPKQQKGHRTLLSRIFSLLSNRILPYPVPDTQAGFKAFRGNVGRRLFTQTTITRFCFDVEVVLLAETAALRIVSIPVNLVNQSASSVRVWRDGVQMCKDLIRLYARHHEFLTRKTYIQFVGYGLVGILNTMLNFAIINSLMFLTGVTEGVYLLAISTLSFVIVVAHSFMWNRYLVFRTTGPSRNLHTDYARFIFVSTTTALISLLLLHTLVNIIGAPDGVSSRLWVNLVLCFTIPISVVSNFIGYKTFVFSK